MIADAETGLMHLCTQEFWGSHQKLEEAKDLFSQEPQREMALLGFGLLAHKSERIDFSNVKQPSLQHLVTADTGN